MLASPEVEAEECLTRVEGHIELTAEDLWDDVSARLREALNDTTYSTWFGEGGYFHSGAMHVIPLGQLSSGSNSTGVQSSWQYPVTQVSTA